MSSSASVVQTLDIARDSTNVWYRLRRFNSAINCGVGAQDPEIVFSEQELALRVAQLIPCCSADTCSTVDNMRLPLGLPGPRLALADVSIA